MTVRLNGSTSGYVELDAPAVAGNNTLRFPGGNGTANQFLKNGATPGSLGWSSLTEDASNNLTQGGYPAAVCRAWVNFNGTGTVAIRAAYNVSSITDNGVGSYTVNFTTAMVDANYCVQTTSSYATGVTEAAYTTVNGDQLFTASGFNVKVRDDNAVARDSNYVFAAIFR